MKRKFTVKAKTSDTYIFFEVYNRTPRRNEYERGQVYGLAVGNAAGEYRPTGHTFSTIRAAKEYATKNYFIWL